MATFHFHDAPQDYESRKLQQALRLDEGPARGDPAEAVPSFTPSPEAARTRRLRGELDTIDAGAAAFLLAALALIVAGSILYF